MGKLTLEIYRVFCWNLYNNIEMRLGWAHVSKYWLSEKIWNCSTITNYYLIPIMSFSLYSYPYIKPLLIGPAINSQYHNKVKMNKKFLPANIQRQSKQFVVLNEWEPCGLYSQILVLFAVLWHKSWIWWNSGASRRQRWLFLSSWRLLQLKFDFIFHMNATYLVYFTFLIFFFYNFFGG